MTKKETIKTLKFNREIAVSYLSGDHTKEFKAETRGIVDGYDFAIILLEGKKAEPRMVVNGKELK